MKDKTASSRSDKQSPVLRGVLPALCVVLAVFAFAVQPPAELFRGFWRILISDAGLITDPAVTGGAGAALLNAALVLALSTALVYGMHLPVTGLTFACLFIHPMPPPACSLAGASSSSARLHADRDATEWIPVFCRSAEQTAS